jgi:hypothetical protein
MKTIYFLFGEQATASYLNGGLKQLVKDNNIIEATIYAHPKTASPFDLLDAFNGCFDYATITKQEYEFIKKSQELY